MQKKYRWEKGLFSTTYKIYSQQKVIGMLEGSSLTRKIIGQINGVPYTFRTNGFFCQETKIMDSTNQVIGNIAYNTWRTKATIIINEKIINWKYDNIWNTQWSLFDTAGTHIKCTGSSLNGKIESNTEDDLLLLCGLFVTNYYWQTSIAIIVAALVPIWITVLN